MKRKSSFLGKGFLSASVAVFIICWVTEFYTYEWEKTYGGSACDGGYSVRQTTDGGYIIAGYTMSLGTGRSDVYLIYYKPQATIELTL